MHDDARPGAGEAGFSLLELTVAIALLAVVALGFAASAGVGFRTVAAARQRLTAAELASARLEHLRSLPFDQLALASAPAPVAAVDHPDHWLAPDGSYDVTGAGVREPLVVDVVRGLVLHREDPVTVGATRMEVYQYVTRTAPAGAVMAETRRVTVVVRYKVPAGPASARLVRASTLFTAGATSPTVPVTTVPGPTAPGTTVPPTTAVPSACPGDVTGPMGSMQVGAAGPGSEAGFTPVPAVSVTLVATDPCAPLTARLSNDGATWGAPVAVAGSATTVSWSLTGGDGPKQVWARAADGRGNAAALGSAGIVLDATVPGVPGILARSVRCAQGTRTVGLTWGPASDTNLRGYRLYRSTDGATWVPVAITGGLGADDTHDKQLDSVRYRVVAYDKAGNESAPTNIVSLAKNQCS